MAQQLAQDSGAYGEQRAARFGELTPSRTGTAKEGYETTMSEATYASGIQDRPVIPILDLNAVGNGKRRSEKTQDAAAQLSCESTGCDFGWVECNMLPPPKESRGTNADSRRWRV